MSAPRELPILFSGPLVRAILDGRKTVTRPPVTTRNGIVDGQSSGKRAWAGLDLSRAWVDQGPSPAGNPGPYLKVPRVHADSAEWLGGDETVHRVYPRWQVGDLLWVRETHAVMCDDADPACWCEDESRHYVEYRADTGNKMPGGWEPSDENPDAPRWTPSIHMPKWAARIWLRVEAVTVERVQDITEEQAKAEGVEPVGGSYREGLRRAWNDIYGQWRPIKERNEAGKLVTVRFECMPWDREDIPPRPDTDLPCIAAPNPWVWAVSFSVASTTGRPS